MATAPPSAPSSSASTPVPPNPQSTHAPQPSDPPPSLGSIALLPPHFESDLDAAPLCRVCRSDDPSLGQLFHPCRCTGSIAHVHQDCLSTWLSHSKKSSCELCGHLFSFEKVYKPGSPARPPFTTITFQALKELFKFFLLFCRAILVGLCWLGIVPWSVVWVSTAYWKAADWFALGITSNIDQFSRSSNLSSDSQLLSPSRLNSTVSPDPSPLNPRSSSSINSTLSNWVTTLTPSLDLDPNSIALDIFQGQLITCAIILSFVVIFLLREWILQNTPPPDLILEDEDEERPQQHFQPIVVRVQPEQPPQNRLIRIMPVDPEDLAWSHATHFVFSDTPSQHIPPNLVIPAESAQPSISTQVSPEVEAKSNESLEQVTSTQSSSASTEQSTEQPITTPGLLELADPGLGMPFYKAHDPIDPDLFSHRILVSSVFLLFVAEKCDSPPLVCRQPRSPHFGDPDEHQRNLMRAWTNLAELAILQPSTDISNSVRKLRNFVLRSNSQDCQSASVLQYQKIELNWTRALLSDPKISKHIQYLFNTRSSTQANQTRDQIRQKGLIYSLLSIYILIENQNSMINENSNTPDDSEPTVPSHSHERIYDVLRLFVLPLLDLPANGEERDNKDQYQPNKLEIDIYQMIQEHDPTINSSNSVVDDSFAISSMSSLKDTIVKILVKQRILCTLISSAAFVRYSRGMAFDDNLFTNWRLKSTRGFPSRFLHPQIGRSAVANPENDLSEITMQLINYKASTISTKVEPSSPSTSHVPENDEAPTDWIDYSTLEHKLLVTSFYLLFSGEEADAVMIVPVLQNPILNSLLEHANDQETPRACSLHIKAWSKVVKSCTTQPSSELLRHFKNFTLRTSGDLTEVRRVHSFQKLEAEWLSKLLDDSLIAQFLVSILTTTTDGNHQECQPHSSRMNEGTNDNQTLNLFLLKLVYVYIVLATIVPLRSAQTVPSATKQQLDSSAMIHKNSLKILEEHLASLEGASKIKGEERQDHDQTRHQTQVSEMIRETRFLLDACRPLPPPAAKIKAASSNLFSSSTITNYNSEGGLRSELFIGRRLKVGIIGILARQKVLNMIVMDRNFSKYARAMLAEPNLFSRIPGLSWNLQEPVEDDADKTSEFDEQTVDLTQSMEKVPLPKENRSDDRQSIHINASHPSHLPGTPSESATRTQPPDRSSHINTSKETSLPNQTKSCAIESSSEPGSSAPNGAISGQQPVSDQHSQIAVPQERENIFQAAPNQEIGRAGAPAAERPLAGHLPELVPQRAQRDAILAAGIGAGLVDAFAFEDVGANGGEEELMAEDIDGILELIGMKGSLLMLAQNVGLMTMLLSLSLLAFVHLPHMMGKIAILVKAHRLLAPPFKGLFILQRYVHLMLDWLSDYFKLYFQNCQLPASLERVLSSIGGSSRSISGFSSWIDRWPVRDILRSTRHFGDQLRPTISKFWPLNTIWIKFGQQVSDQMNSIAYGSRPFDRALAVLIGYFELILMSLLYLSSGLDQQRAKFVSETLVNGLQQQLLIGKVGIFIFVELVIFPFLCGLLLNFTTIPIFANATMNNRLELYSSSPYSATLITWLVGTCFMFTFAILVSTCRESLRTGVCWWIRDPSDDRFNPIREILERSAWSQVKKISVSAVMYGAVIICGLGSIVFNLVFFTGVLPLRIHADRPLFSSALDLVIYQTFLPLFLEWFKPRTKLKECLQGMSRLMARQLRLTFYLYGERRIEEETTFEVGVRGPDGKFRSLERRTKFSPLTFFKPYRRGSSSSQNNNSDKGGGSSGVSKSSLSRRRKRAGGSFARVPATDSVKVVQGRKMHIPVHVNGTPIDPADMAIIEQQQAEAREEGGGAGADQYTVVYLPPQFQARMILFVVSMWSAAITIVWQLIGIPLLVGRVLLDRFFLSEQEEPHDVYAYAIGAIGCAVIFSIGQKIWEKYSNQPSTSSEEEEEEEEGSVEATNEGGDPERMTNNRQTILQNINWTMKKSLHFLVLTLGGGILLPILTSILVDIYVLGLVRPKRIVGDAAELLPEIFLLEAWNYGAICLSIGARVIKLTLPEHSISIAQDQIMAHWQAGNLGRAVEDINLKLIIPIFYKFSLMILVPFLVVQPFIMLILSRRANYGFGFDHQQEGRNAMEWIFQSFKTIPRWPGSWNGLANKTTSLTEQINNFGNLAESNSSSTNATTTAHDYDHRLKMIELNFLILKLIYPLILSWFSQFYLLKIFFNIFSGWLEKVRDERFLERRKLKNYEPDSSLSDRHKNANIGSH